MTRDSRRRRNFFLEDAEDHPEPGDAFSNPDLDSRVQIFSSEAQVLLSHVSTRQSSPLYLHLPSNCVLDAVMFVARLQGLCQKGHCVVICHVKFCQLGCHFHVGFAILTRCLLLLQLHRSGDPDMYEHSRRRTCRI
jgi:hypothetical protein